MPGLCDLGPRGGGSTEEGQSLAQAGVVKGCHRDAAACLVQEVAQGHRAGICLRPAHSPAAHNMASCRPLTLPNLPSA